MPDNSVNPSHIPYGLREGSVVHISELNEEHKGRRCMCFCPVCASPLLAKSINGKYTAHFAHAHNSSDCALAAETGIHLKAKEIIAKKLSLPLPALVAEVFVTIGEEEYGDSCYVVKEQKGFIFDEARQEEWRGSYRPDLVVVKADRELFVEIKVTHEVDEEKLDKIKKDGVSCLEIDLSKVDRMAAPKDIESAIEEIGNIKWVFHAKKDKILLRLKANILDNSSLYLEEQRKSREDRKERELAARRAQVIAKKKEERKKRYRAGQERIESAIKARVIECIGDMGFIITPALRLDGKVVVPAEQKARFSELFMKPEPLEHGVYLNMNDKCLYIAFFFGEKMHEKRYLKINRRKGYSLGLSLRYLKDMYIQNNDLTEGEVKYHLFGSGQKGGFWIHHPEWKKTTSVSLPRRVYFKR
ncbi:competence protein CoiA family protein [Billgrantia antri]|uniref:competence protein CoiA family protein n=1 Tax=Billgrantia antri TaxID=2846777 RepID=UPI003B20C9B3